VRIFVTILCIFMLMPTYSFAKCQEQAFGKWTVFANLDAGCCYVSQKMEASTSPADMSPEDLGNLMGRVVKEREDGGDVNAMAEQEAKSIVFSIDPVNRKYSVMADTHTIEEMHDDLVKIDGQVNHMRLGKLIPVGDDLVAKEFAVKFTPDVFANAESVQFHINNFPYNLDVTGLQGNCSRGWPLKC
jgi:hypothetical protein